MEIYGLMRGEVEGRVSLEGRWLSFVFDMVWESWWWVNLVEYRIGWFRVNDGGGVCLVIVIKVMMSLFEGMEMREDR